LNKKTSKIAALAFKVFFSLALLIFLATQIDYSAISLLEPGFIPVFLLALFINLGALATMTVRWNQLIKSHLDTNLNFLTAFQYYLTGSFFNIFMPGSIGGDVARTQRLVTRHKISAGKATILTIAERMAGMFALVLVLSLSFMALNYPPDFNIEAYLPLWLLRLSPVFILLCIPVLKWLLAKRRFKTSYRYIIQIILLSALAQSGDIIIAWLFSNWFGLEMDFSAFLFIMPLVYVATVLPISLGGLGVREGAFSGLMVMYGADVSVAVLIALLMYLVKVVIGIIGYGVYVRQ